MLPAPDAHERATDTGRNDFSTIDRFGVGELVVALGKLRPHMMEDVPMDYRVPYAELQATIVGEVEDVFANHADDAMAVNRALKWALVSHALVFRGRSKHRGQRRFRDNVQTRFVLWREGNYRKLLDLMMKAADKVRRPKH